MIMTSASLDRAQRADLPRSLKGNLCRCTGYRSITDALHGTQDRAGDVAGQACGASLRQPVRPGHRDGPGPLHHGRADLEGLLHLKVVRSPHAHARLRSIDRSKALAHPRRGRGLHLGRRAAPPVQHAPA
jgi:hypothetical protein